jgi:hypothetical protein
VGHAAVLRDPVRPTPVLAAADDDTIDDDGPVDTGQRATSSTLDPPDLKLAFDYLPEYAVIVVAERLQPSRSMPPRGRERRSSSSARRTTSPACRTTPP